MGKKPLLVQRATDDARDPKFSVYCVGYEDTRWRAEEMVKDFFRRHLSSFALTYCEWDAIDGDSAADALARSARMVYDTDKYQRRGEFGELFLHGILRDFYAAEPAVSKIYYADGPNETAKGFDSVHVVVNPDGELDLWLGEAKLYQSMNGAISEIASSLNDHIGNDFLRREFLAVTNKLDDKWPHASKLSDLLDENTSLDAIIDRIVMPVLLTYQSSAVASHDKVTQEYETALLAEACLAGALGSVDVTIGKCERAYLEAVARSHFWLSWRCRRRGGGACWGRRVARVPRSRRSGSELTPRLPRRGAICTSLAGRIARSRRSSLVPRGRRGC